MNAFFEFMFDLGKNGDILARFIYIIEEVSLTTASSLLSKVEEVFQTRNVNMNIYICCSFMLHQK